MSVFSLAQVTAWIISYKYAILLPIAIIEGPIVTVISGLLVAHGYLNWVIVYGVVMLGDLIGDVVWYYLGYHFGHRFVAKFGKRFDLTEDKIEHIKKKFHEHKHPILFLSKITGGLGFAVVVLFTAGMSRIPFRRYLLVNTLGQLFWSGLLLGSGYFFGTAFINIQSIEERFVFIVCAIVALILLVRYVRNVKMKIIS